MQLTTTARKVGLRKGVFSSFFLFLFLIIFFFIVDGGGAGGEGYDPTGRKESSIASRIMVNFSLLCVGSLHIFLRMGFKGPASSKQCLKLKYIYYIHQL